MSLNFLNISLQSQQCKVCPRCLCSYANFPNTQEDRNERLEETKRKDIWFLLPWPTILMGYLCAAYWPWHCASLSVLGYSPVCPPCNNEMKTDAILEHMCASEFGKCFETLLSHTHKNILRWKLRCHFQDSQKPYIPAGHGAKNIFGAVYSQILLLAVMVSGCTSIHKAREPFTASPYAYS